MFVFSRHIPAHFRPLLPLLWVSLICLCLHCRVAVAAPARPATPLPAVTLAGALAAVPPPAQGALLAVGAERVTLPTKPAGENAPTDPRDIASFGYERDVCGAVTAVAPSTMVVLNEDPAAPDVTADLRPTEAFQVLAAGLDDPQWGLLTSDRGLGLSDLRDETQQRLFQALFPHGRLLVAGKDPSLADMPDGKRTDVQDLTDQIGAVRVRLGQTSHIYVHDTAGKTIFFGGGRPDAAGRLTVYTPKRDPGPEEHGVLLRAVVPNAAKAADLVYRIGGLTRTEVYADPHYAGRSVTVIGGPPSAPAADLLRALALCVTGTYRRVGPAYVLTDDLSGVGTRRQRLAEWEGAARDAKADLSDRAGLALLERRASGSRTLPSFGDPLALTPDQIKAEGDDASIPELPSEFQSYYAFSKLTPAQQGWARRIAADYEAQRSAGTLPEYLSKYGPAPGAADLTGKVDLAPRNTVQLIVPSVGSPIDTDFVYGPTSLLYWPGMAALEKRQHEAAVKKVPVQVSPPQPQSPAPTLASVLLAWHRRAVLAHPRTAADVDALVTAMQKIGLNELWLEVFSDGVAHVSGSAPAVPPSGPDILQEALAQTKGTGIAVYADMSLLPWGDGPPPAARDLDILGRDYRQAMTAVRPPRDNDGVDADGNPIPFVPPPIPVSPASMLVGNTLTALTGTLAARPGLAGFVWEDAKAEGGLGYTPEMRLSFLRTAPADPLDITPENARRLSAGLPAFDDEATDGALADSWNTARKRANADLLLAMRGTADAAGLPVFMEQGDGDTDWLVSWDDSAQLPPPLRPLFQDNAYRPSGDVSAAARKQGRAVLLRESVRDAGDADTLARTLKSDRKSVGWDGFVLDFTDPSATRGAAPLAALVRAVPPSAPVKAP